MGAPVSTDARQPPGTQKYESEVGRDVVSATYGPFKRQPRQRQLEALAVTCTREYAALFMEQRTGKTQVVLDTATHLYRKGLIRTLIVVAPNGVHRQWITDEAPEVLGTDTQWRGLVWRSNKSQLKSFQKAAQALVAHKGLAVFAVNVEALPLKRLREYLGQLLRRGPCLSVIDESLDIGTPGAKRTRIALRLGQRSAYRRILDGTPYASGPLAVWSQFEFLKPNALGFRTHQAFKLAFAEWETGVTFDREGNERTYKRVVRYKNVERLHELTAPYVYRVTRAQCADLPPKVYEKRYFELTDEQRRLYQSMRQDYVAELASGDTVTAAHVLTRYLRLQQITSNFMPGTARLMECPVCQGADTECRKCAGYGVVSDRTQPAVPLSGANPRLETLIDAVAKLGDQQGIIWARFQHDVDLITDAFASQGAQCAAYDGRVSIHDRAAIRDRFKSGLIQFLIGNSRAGGKGLDMSAASFVCYYSHDPGLRIRQQSEDRAQSLTKTDPVLYLDLVAEDTVDEKIIAALRAGKNLADTLMGEPKGEWI